MTHRAIDAALQASEHSPIPRDSIESIVVHVPEGSTSALIHHRPQTGLEGKFSMEYCMTAAALDGEVRFRSFEDESVQRPNAQDLLRRVEVVYRPRDGNEAQPTEVSIRLRAGGERTGSVLNEHGSPNDPLTWDELEAKYRDCAARALPAPRIEESYRLIAGLESLRHVRELMTTLAGDEAKESR